MNKFKIAYSGCVILLAALVPLLFAPGIVGRFLNEFSVTLATAIAVSAVVSLTLTPMMCARLLGDGKTRPAESRFGRALDRALEELQEDPKAKNPSTKWRRKCATCFRFRLPDENIM